MINHIIKPEAGSLKLTGFAPKLTYTVITKAVARNWPIIALYIIINIGGVVGAYFFTTPWLSAAASCGVSIISTLVGYFMMGQVVTITNEVR
jgi:hypothetical protein